MYVITARKKMEKGHLFNPSKSQLCTSFSHPFSFFLHSHTGTHQCPTSVGIFFSQCFHPIEVACFLQDFSLQKTDKQILQLQKFQEVTAKCWLYHLKNSWIHLPIGWLTSVFDAMFSNPRPRSHQKRLSGEVLKNKRGSSLHNAQSKRDFLPRDLKMLKV